MIKLTKNQILSWTGGENNFKDYNPEINNVVTDSRKIQENDCYIAIKGENFDGHDFIEASKCTVSLMQRDHKERYKLDIPLIIVDDILEGLNYYFSYYN